MNDPHVDALHYHVVVGENVDFRNTPGISASTDKFDVRLEAGSTIFKMKKHYGSIEEARAVTDSFINAWNVLIGLEIGPGELKLVFDKADVIDRMPQPITDPHRVNLEVHVVEHVHTMDSVTLHISRGKYPAFPTEFRVSPDVESMYLRYTAYRQGRETLLSMAYMCLTILEASARGRRNTAALYKIDQRVLSTLGRLTSTKGDVTEARKYPTNGHYRQINSKEREWIVSVVKAIILRVGQYAYDSKTISTPLSVSGFPDLSAP